MEKYNTDGKENDFAAMLEESFADTGRLRPGQQIETEIVSISGDTIFLQLNGKSEGVLESAELIDKDGKLSVKEGDTIKAYFLSADRGQMNFTTKISGDKAGSEVLQTAFGNGIPVEGVVEKEIKGGFEIKIGDSRAFCPYSQMGLKRVENASDWIGRTLPFKISEFSENGRNILVSNKAILVEEHERLVEDAKTSLKEGLTIKGIVKQIESFGAFVDIDGIQALLPISEISRERVEDINSVLKVGQEITASIIKLDWRTEKISVSMKALLADPWDTAVTNYKKGSKHEGTIARITNFGAFITLEPGLDGLVHISKLRTDSRDNNPVDKLKPGKSIAVIIEDIDEEKRRLSLKPATSFQEDETAQKYMETETNAGSDTYNPFAALLKDRKK